MSKNIIQDVVKKNNYSNGSSREPFVDYPKKEIRENKKNSQYTLWLVAVISVVFLFFAISYLFSSAKITVIPKTKDFVITEPFKAIKNPSSSDTESISYNTVTLSGEESKKVLSGEEKDYLEPATGEVLIYNAFSSSSQILSADTKLEGSNGKIYKTKTKVTIPGITSDGNPGKEQVSIYSVAPGKEYNSSAIDFKILGFKGTSKYQKIYGRSVGEISGGLNGKSRQVSDEDKTKAEEELKQSLTDKLFKKAQDQTPEKFILFKDASFLNVDDENMTPVAEDGNATITIKGTFYGVIFNKDEISNKIANSVLDTEDKSKVYIANLSILKFSSDSVNMSLFDTDDSVVNILDFNLSGSAKIVWEVNQDNIISSLLGRNKSDFDNIMLQNGNIDSATSVIKPVWRSSFPDKIDKIKVIVNYPS